MITFLILAAVTQTIPVDDSLLAGLASHAISLSAHGKTQTCSGPLLADILKRKGLPGGESLRGGEMRRGVLVHARDGYEVLFSLGELDATLGNRQAIIATSCDGKPLEPDAGPYRLVVGGEARPARSVRQIDSIAIIAP